MAALTTATRSIRAHDERPEELGTLVTRCLGTVDPSACPRPAPSFRQCYPGIREGARGRVGLVDQRFCALDRRLRGQCASGGVLFGAGDESVCKPDSVTHRRSGGRRSSICDRCCQRPGAIYPEARASSPQALPPCADAPFLILLRVGFTEPPQSPGVLVVSYTTVSPLPPVPCGTGGGLLSVALSRGSPRVGVTHHPALRSPDFPRCALYPRWRTAIARPTRPPTRLAVPVRSACGLCR